MLTKLLQLVKTHQSDVVLVGSVVVLTVVSFNLGRIYAAKNEFSSTREKATIYAPSSSGVNENKLNINQDLSVVASKKSKSKFYHFSWCSGAKQISEANKISFSTETEAIAAGYTLASNCKK